MKTIEVTLNEKRNVRLTAFIQDVGKEYRNITRGKTGDSSMVTGNL